MENPVIILGAGYLGRQAKDILESNGNVVYGFLDDNKKLHNTEIDNASVLGSTEDEAFLKLIGKKCDAFVALDENKVRKNLVTMLNKEYKVAGYNFLNQNPFTGDFVGRGVLVPVGQPGFDPTLGRTGVLTAYYGNPRQVFLSAAVNF